MIVLCFSFIFTKWVFGFLQCGVKNGMFMGKAKGVCPELLTIPYDFEQYKAVSMILYDTVAR